MQLRVLHPDFSILALLRVFASYKLGQLNHLLLLAHVYLDSIDTHRVKAGIEKQKALSVYLRDSYRNLLPCQLLCACLCALFVRKQQDGIIHCFRITVYIRLFRTSRKNGI